MHEGMISMDAAPLAAPAPVAELGELWRPLDALARWIKRGAALAHDDGWYVLQMDGQPIPGARARDLDALAATLENRDPARRPTLAVKVQRPLIAEIRRVMNRGESLSAFVRAALRREVEGRHQHERDMAMGVIDDAA